MLADYTSMTAEFRKQVDAKLAELSEAGMELTGFKKIELLFVAPTNAVAAELKQRLYHPDGSMAVTCGNADSTESQVRLRMELELKAAVICSYLWSFDKIATEYGARLLTWEVVA